MRALAWDNDYDERRRNDLGRLEQLKSSIRETLDFLVYDSPAEFQRAADGEQHYDFFIIDWYDGDQEEDCEEAAGELLVRLLRVAYPHAPIFVYSRYNHKITENQLAAAGLVFFKSKYAPVEWVAADILATLRALKLVVDSQKVFLIYGHDAQAKGTTALVKRFLHKHGVKAISIDPSSSYRPLLSELEKGIASCAAFIAVCTPDDQAIEVSNPKRACFQPRQNVLFELGMVCGLSRGLERLTILEKRIAGAADAEQTRLPSDWGGYLTLRFTASVKECFEQLDARLRRIGVGLESPTQTRKKPRKV